jgi:hypothetical protein
MGEFAATLITVLIGGILSGGLTSYFLAKSNKKKNEAEASEKITAAAMLLIEPLKKRIAELEPLEKKVRNLEQLIPQVKRLEALTKRYSRFTQQLLDGIRQLLEQVRQRDGEEPVWTPDEIAADDWPPAEEF